MTRLMNVAHEITHGTLAGMRFKTGDVVVVNDAATLPASLHTDGGIEVRLAAWGHNEWTAVLLGAGDWRTRTEDRPAPAPQAVGAELRFGDGLVATVTGHDPLSRRLVRLRFNCDATSLAAALYRVARPVQYAHADHAFALYDAQTRYAGEPWAVEMPSAGWALRWQQMEAWRAAGIAVVALTHAAGLSATGDRAIDAALPLPERYRIPSTTRDTIAQAAGRVIAIGTSVVRALETAALTGADEGVSTLRIGPDHTLRTVDALLTGIHDVGTSHHALMQAFAPAEVLARAHAEAVRLGYRPHEHGDVALVWRLHDKMNEN